MADVQTLPEICCLKNSEILVHVEEALLDFLVVSYEYDNKLYQGVLLDASKRSLPCGILGPPGFPEADTAQHGLGNEEDKMHSVAQRFSYFQGKSPPHLSTSMKDYSPPGSAFHMRRAMRGGLSKFKSSRMTVRLRPRQVLCSKCKSICNENSENVDLSKKRKGEETSRSSDVSVEKRICPPRQISPKSPRPPFSENPQDNKTSNTLAAASRRKSSSPPDTVPPLHTSIIPNAVKESEIAPSLKNSVSKIKIVGSYWTRQLNDPKATAETSRRTNAPRTKTNGSKESEPSVVFLEDNSENKNSSFEDCDNDNHKDVSDPLSCEPHDADNFKQNSNASDGLDNFTDSPAKLNSSFASSETDESQDRMVLRKKRNVGSMEDLWDESVFLEDTTRRTTPVIKISFGTQGEGTVLKIPAKVRSFHDSDSDGEDPDSSPLQAQTKDVKAKAAKRALKKAKKEARRKTTGEGCPSRSPDGNSPDYESTLYHKRRKRKVKHKKRHKEIRVQHEINNIEGEVDMDVPPLLEEDPLKIDDTLPIHRAEESLSDHDSMKEKCLKQKLSISLKRLNATAYAHCGDTSSSAGSYSPGSNSELSCGDELPDFPTPPPNNALSTVDSCLTSDGRTMEVGDVVWGKIHGFPWWPGKVLSITIERKDDGTPIGHQAHVAWYGSSTSSLMSCDQLSPFLETFKARYNKKKRGPYKEAIRQATSEARKDSHSPFQEIDVVS